MDEAVLALVTLVCLLYPFCLVMKTENELCLLLLVAFVYFTVAYDDILRLLCRLEHAIVVLNMLLLECLF